MAGLSTEGGELVRCGGLRIRLDGHSLVERVVGCVDPEGVVGRPGPSEQA